MKALTAYIFGGSQTIGHIQAGWEIDRVLEMTENMKEINAYHFTKNYPEISVLCPSEWNNEDYIELLKNEQYDLFASNPPCSGLSSINRNASVSGDINKHIYEIIDLVKKIQPKTFLIENAPTLTKMGLPILKDISKILKDNYKLIIINDLAGNHSVPMHRRRTLVVGFNQEYFNGIPLINANKQNIYTVKDAFKGITNDLPNMEFDKDVKDRDFMRFYNLVEPKKSILITLSDKYDLIKNQLTEKENEYIRRFNKRREQKDSIWDKSSWRLDENDLAPSMTSISQFIHPTENRDLYIREYARLIGYPDDFIFYPNECSVSTIQCLAQGVPVNFIKYISTEIKNCFENKYELLKDCDIVYINQTTNKRKIVKFKLNEFLNCDDIGRNDIIKEVSLW